MRMPAPTAGQTKHSPTPAATTPTMASVPHGSFLIASQAAPSLLCSALSITWPNSSTDSGRIPVGSAQLIGSFQLYVYEDAEPLLPGTGSSGSGDRN